MSASLALAAALPGIFGTAQPMVVRPFISAVMNNDWSRASKMASKSIELQPNMVEDLHVSHVPFSALSKWVKGCVPSPALSIQGKGYFDLWFNCGTRPRADGQVGRKFIRLYLMAGESRLRLASLAVGDFPDRESGTEVRNEVRR